MMYNLVELVDYSEDHYEGNSIFRSLVGKIGGFSSQGLDMSVDRVGVGKLIEKERWRYGKEG